MKFCTALLASLLMVATAAFAGQKTTITGTVLGHDGRPMRLADVHVMKPSSQEAEVSANVSADGRFSIQTDLVGVFNLMATGVDHEGFTVPLYIETPGQVELNITLRAYDYDKDMADVKIIGDFNNFAFGKAQDMKRQPDGSYVAEFKTKAKTFSYQILGIAGGRSVNGTQSESYTYDGGGDYRSVVTPTKGKVRIVFDPKKLVRSDVAASVRFADPTSLVARVSEVLTEINARDEAYAATVAEFKASGRDAKEFKYDWSGELASLSQKIASEKNPTVRQALLYSYVAVRSKDRDAMIAKLAMAEIPPTSLLWSLSPWNIPSMMSAANESDNSYAQQAIASHPDRMVRAALLYNELASASYGGKQDDAARYYQMMMKDYSDTEYGRMAKMSFSPDRAIQVGKHVPEFSFASLEDPNVVYSNASMAGKIYMIDFWATWCGPCIGEMDHIHAAYEKFKDRGLQILSLSFDAKPEDVTNFRATKKWKMPWLHAFVQNGFKNEQSQRFEVSGIPKPILVDANGMIIATEGELRGDDLEKTLTRVFDGQTMGAK